MNNKRRMFEARIRSSLAGHVTSGTDLEQLKRDGWREQGIFVVDMRYTGLNDNERAFLNNLGSKIYGRRHGT
jgi:hypothetical protein